MKLRTVKFLAATFVFVPVAAYAQGDLPMTDRILSDPLYLPLQGVLYGDTSYSWATTTQDVFNASGIESESQRLTDNDIHQTLEYGITNDLAVNFNMGYDPSNTTKTNVFAGTETSLTDQGWTDPEFGIVYRALDQNFYPFTLDLRGSYAPNWISAKSATDAGDGSVARGGQLGDFGLTLGRETEQFTIAGTFDAQYSDTRKIADQATGADIFTGAYWLYDIGLATQWRFSPILSVNAGAGYSFGYNDNVFNTGTSLEHQNRANATPNLNAAVNYHFIPNTLVGSVNYEHEFGGGSNNLYFADPADNYSVHNKSTDILGVSLRYQFW
jgi:hypothetical protein